MRTLGLALVGMTLALTGCGTPISPVAPATGSSVLAQDADQERGQAYAAVREHFVTTYGQHIFSMQFGVEGPVYAFAVTIGEDAASKVKYLGRYDLRSGKIMIDDVQDLGRGR